MASTSQARNESQCMRGEIVFRAGSDRNSL